MGLPAWCFWRETAVLPELTLFFSRCVRCTKLRTCFATRVVGGTRSSLKPSSRCPSFSTMSCAKLAPNMLVLDLESKLRWFVLLRLGPCPVTGFRRSRRASRTNSGLAHVLAPKFRPVSCVWLQKPVASRFRPSTPLAHMITTPAELCWMCCMPDLTFRLYCRTPSTSLPRLARTRGFVPGVPAMQQIYPGS